MSPGALLDKEEVSGSNPEVGSSANLRVQQQLVRPCLAFGYEEVAACARQATAAAWAVAPGRGGFANSTVRPSAMVGCVRMASRSPV